MKQQKAVYVVDGLRTPFFKARGKPGPFRASDLAVSVGRSLLLKQSRVNATDIDEVVIGCVGPGAEEANIGRIVALRLGCGDKTPGWTVQRNCASGLQAIDSAAANIALGRANLVLAGGTEAMSHHPILLSTAMVAWLAEWSRANSLLQKGRQLARLRPQHLQLVIALLKGLTDPVTGLSMGQTAENLAHRFHITRLAMDRFAWQSHQRLARAVDEGGFDDEIVPLVDSDGVVYQHDDGLRRDSDEDKLNQLKPIFDRPYGLVTAGNSSQVSDGAALMLLASEQAVDRFDLPVLGRIVDSHWAALDPNQMGLGPVHAMALMLQRQQLTAKEIDNWEINEAFAAQVLASLQAWQSEEYLLQEVGVAMAQAEIPLNKLNVNGGAISIGHPVGASGARLPIHLLKQLNRSQSRYGVASLCVGGGQGGAILLEAQYE